MIAAVLGLKVSISGPKPAKATNSLTTIFCPTKLPEATASSSGTPIITMIGANTQPRICWKVRSSAPNQPPTVPISRLISAIREMKASSIAPTVRASRSPSAAPPAAASMTLL